MICFFLVCALIFEKRNWQVCCEVAGAFDGGPSFYSADWFIEWRKVTSFQENASVCLNASHPPEFDKVTQSKKT